MMHFDDIAAELEDQATDATRLLLLGESILAAWVVAHGDVPTDDTREGFRLLALHRQGAKNEPSFNACRETCRELVYHYNVVTDASLAERAERLTMMRFVARHLLLFVRGKLEESALGDFCCSSRPLRGAQPVAAAKRIEV